MKISFFFFSASCALVFCALLLFSCSKDKVTPPDTQCNTTISYTNDVLPIIQAKCIGCHAQGNASGGYNFSSYASIAANANAILGSLKASGYQLMPIGGPALPDSVIQKIDCWIDQGKLDN